MEALAAYLLYRMTVLNPICTHPSPVQSPSRDRLPLRTAPVYLKLLPPGSKPTTDLEEFLTLLAQRMGMIQRRNEPDLSRAAVYFVRWWREEGGLLAAKDSFQLQKFITPRGTAAASPSSSSQVSDVSPLSAALPENLGLVGSGLGDTPHAISEFSGPKVEGWGFDFQWDWQEADLKRRITEPELFVQEKMEGCIRDYMEMIEREEKEESNVSPTQIKKKMMMEEKERRRMRYADGSKRGGKKPSR